MGNVVDDVAKKTFGAACGNEPDNHLYLSAPAQKKRYRRHSDMDHATTISARDGVTPPRKRKGNYKRRDSNASTMSENDIKYSQHVVDQLVSLGYGTEKECMHASAATAHYWDLQAVAQKLIEIRAKIGHPHPLESQHSLHSLHSSTSTPPSILALQNWPSSQSLPDGKHNNSYPFASRRAYATTPTMSSHVHNHKPSFVHQQSQSDTHTTATAHVHAQAHYRAYRKTSAIDADAQRRFIRNQVSTGAAALSTLRTRALRSTSSPPPPPELNAHVNTALTLSLTSPRTAEFKSPESNPLSLPSSKTDLVRQTSNELELSMSPPNFTKPTQHVLTNSDLLKTIDFFNDNSALRMFEPQTTTTTAPKHASISPPPPPATDEETPQPPQALVPLSPSSSKPSSPLCVDLMEREYSGDSFKLPSTVLDSSDSFALKPIHDWHEMEDSGDDDEDVDNEDEQKGVVRPRPRLRFELKNSISATSAGKAVEQIRKLQQETRGAIEHTLADMHELNSAIVTKATTAAAVSANDAQLQPLNADSLFAAKPPPLIPVASDKIAYWHDSANDTDFAVCCTGNEMFGSGYKSGVYLYDLQASTLQFLCGYPDKAVYANSMGMAIDAEQHKLHLFGGKGLFGQWLILNLKAKLWEVRKDLSKKYAVPFSYHMQSPNCVVIAKSLHVFSRGKFLRYNCRRKKKFMELQTIDGGHVKHVEYMFYVQSQHRIYAFGVHSDGDMRDVNKGNDETIHFDEIWYCEHSESYTEYKWYRYHIKLPYDETNKDKHRTFAACLAFDCVLCIFYHGKNEVWCIDVVKGKKYRCNKLVDIEHITHSQILNTKMNVVHTICMDHNGPVHQVLNLDDVITSSL